MAGDLEIKPSLRSTCIDAVADKIMYYIKQYPPKLINSCVDSASSSSPMDCDIPCVAVPDVAMSSAGDGQCENKMLENIASLEMKCHHDPPCGSIQSSKLTSDPYHDIFIPNPISEDILKCICKKGKLNDDVAQFFADSSRFRMRDVYLKKAGHITTDGLKKLLANHTLYEINAENINESRYGTEVDKKRKKITVADIVVSLNSATKEKLRSLNISGVASYKEDWSPMAIYMKGGEFKKLNALTNIVTLNVSYTNFTDNDLNTLIACLKNLRNLDISQTFVRSILYLGDIHAPKLRSLCMGNLDKLNMPKESLFDVFCKMSELQHLDISTERGMGRSYRNAVTPNVNVAIGMMMVGGFPLPKLVSLDISGREGIEEVAFLNFYSNHPRLTFLGLLLTGLDSQSCFTDEKHENYRTQVKVTGDHTESQVMESLARYYRRPFFAKETLFSLFHQTQLAPQYNKEQLELVLRCMRNHRSQTEFSASVQMAATACVYNLTNREMVLKIPANVLAKVVMETLITMENFKDKQQLQKNCLLTLCSDRILKEVTFDYFKTAQLVMDCLCMNEDSAMHRMSVAIISILAAKISTEETAILGSNTYMKVLLRIVEQKLDEISLDLTLKFTLSALWNLTDESPTTCQNFIDCSGLSLFARILSVNEDNPCLQTKVLGLLNNLAEVPALRRYLLEHDVQLIRSVHALLSSKHIEVSYFAAGIISHLAMLGSNAWTDLTGERNYRNTLLEDLYKKVLAWEPPQGEMVAYRTFKPFFPLLECHDTPAVQLWAAWAVRHVCKRNGEKYREMLVLEQGLECLINVKKNQNLDEQVREVVDSALSFVSENMPPTIQMSSGICLQQSP